MEPLCTPVLIFDTSYYKMTSSVHSLAEQLQLLPHPEGGYFRETYRSGELIPQPALPSRFDGERTFATAIYFLLTAGNFSAFHRIKSDECWHFYAGSTLHVHVLTTTGEYQLIRLGNDMQSGETFQAVVPAGAWFASETTGDHSLVGCTVSPGFDFRDFELADFAALSAAFPSYASLIRRLCR
jgi:predicted cupin superfamily sugar epimerase